MGEKYFEPRVLRNGTLSGERYAIHEVYFGANGAILCWTEDALSPDAGSVEELAMLIRALLPEDGQTISCGTLGYEYARPDLEEWLAAMRKPVLYL